MLKQIQITYHIKKVLLFFTKISGVLLLMLMGVKETAQAQEINFGEYSSLYSVSINDLMPAEDLEFGMVISNEGVVTKSLLNAKVLSIEGVKYLDVIVDITADAYLLLDGDLGNAGNTARRIPFTLQAAYANRGANNTSQAIQMPVASNIASAQFPVRYRGTNPPGPPPTPVYKGYNPALYNETAYLYLYGSLNVGAINAGSYSANITITISYD